MKCTYCNKNMVSETSVRPLDVCAQCEGLIDSVSVQLIKEQSEDAKLTRNLIKKLRKERKEARAMACQWCKYAYRLIGIAAVYGIHGDVLSEDMPRKAPPWKYKK